MGLAGGATGAVAFEPAGPGLSASQPDAFRVGSSSGGPLGGAVQVLAVVPSLRTKRHHVSFLRNPESNYSEKDSGGGHGCHGRRRG